MTILAPKIPSSVTIFAEIDATRDDTFLRGLRGYPSADKGVWHYRWQYAFCQGVA